MPIDDDWVIRVRQDGDSVVVDCEEAMPADATFRLYGTRAYYDTYVEPQNPVLLWGEAPAVFPIAFTQQLLETLPMKFYGVIIGSDGKLLGHPSRDVGITLYHPDDKKFGYTLTMQVYTNVPMPGDVTGYRAVIKLTETKGLPRACFLFRKNKDGLRRVGNDFLCVCHPGDFYLPENEPDPETGKYRMSSIDIITESVEEREQFWDAAIMGMDRLVYTMEQNTTVDEVRTHVG